MVSGLFHIKINGDEENKDKGFFTLLTSGASIFCLEDEEYIIPEEAIEKLNEKEIGYGIVTKKETINKTKETKDASKTQM